MTQKSAKLSYEDLYPYQRRMIEHIRENDCCALWVDMGLGKTVATLTAIKHLKDELEVANVLVVGPKRVIRKTWPDEIKGWDHLTGLTYSVISGSGADQRLAAAKKRVDIHLINTENLQWLLDQFMEQTESGHWRMKAKWPWDMVVLDESTRFKNQDSNRYRAIRRVRKFIDRLVELTGTPAPKGLKDLWGQVFLMDFGCRLGNTQKAFKNRFMSWCDSLGDYYIPREKEQHIHNQVSDIALTLKAEDYLELPPVIGLDDPRGNVWVAMSDSEAEEYEDFKRNFVMELQGSTVTAANAGVLWGKLLQLANGAVYTEAPNWEEFHNAKLEALMEIEEALQDKPMMVVYNYRSDLARIVREFNRAKVNYRVLDTEQDEIDWNEGRIERLLFHPASAGHGTNLHKNGCEDLVWFGLTANTENYLQANARIAGGHRRVGKRVHLHHILCEDSHDSLCKWILEGDLGTQERLIEATKKVIRGER